MILEQTIIEKTFVVTHRGKIYYVDYINSDGHTLALFNRDYWEITDENHDALNIYILSNMTREDKQKAKKNLILFDKLVDFCIKNFHKYSPELKVTRF